MSSPSPKEKEKEKKKEKGKEGDEDFDGYKAIPTSRSVPPVSKSSDPLNSSIYLYAHNYIFTIICIY